MIKTNSGITRTKALKGPARLTPENHQRISIKFKGKEPERCKF